MRAFVTGISGFKGSHLAELLLQEGMEVHGLVRFRSNVENLQHIQDRLHLHTGDIRDESCLRNVLANVKPDYIWHFCGISFVPASWAAPLDTMDTNVKGTCALLEAVRDSCPDARVALAGTSEEYGLQAPGECPVKETSPLRPLSPYAVSKVAVDLLGWQYHRSYGLKIVRCRSFNTTGPRRGETYMTSTFAKQIAEIEAGKRKVLLHGNLDAIRDFQDVRDAVRGYRVALDKCRWGEVYNICSGVGRSAQEVLDTLCGLSTAEVKTEADSKRMRPSDVPLLVGDASKFRNETGWTPKVPWATTMADLLSFWRARV